VTDTSADPRRAFERAAVECVARSAGSVALCAMREAPDADLLHEQGFHLGLEVVRTVDQSYLDAKRRMEETTKAVQAELETRGVHGHIYVYFDVNEILSTPPNQRRRVPKQIAAFERHPGANFETPEVKAGGVDCVAQIERTPAPMTVVSLGWRSQSLNGSLAAICLQKKDERLRHYRSANGDHFKEYWLAIASLGPGTVEDGGFEMLLKRDFATDFDRVFLIMRGIDGRFVVAQDVTPARPATCDTSRQSHFAWMTAPSPESHGKLRDVAIACMT
jgi:hypothetical protein